MSKPFFTLPISIGISKKPKNSAEIFKKLEKSIQNLYKNGRLKEIAESFYGPKVPEYVLLHKNWQALRGVMLSVLAFESERFGNALEESFDGSC